jgi:Protein of unknown function (DUF2924)
MWIQSPPSSRLRRSLLFRILSYRLQEQAFGGISLASHRRLLEMAKKLKASPDDPLSHGRSVKPGTRLIRQWNNRTHVVTVMKGLYEYGGSPYKSLSEIARLITGTQWSGPLFFGLKDKKKQTSNMEAS